MFAFIRDSIRDVGASSAVNGNFKFFEGLNKPGKSKVAAKNVKKALGNAAAVAAAGIPVIACLLNEEKERRAMVANSIIAGGGNVDELPGEVIDPEEIINLFKGVVGSFVGEVKKGTEWTDAHDDVTDVVSRPVVDEAPAATVQEPEAPQEEEVPEAAASEPQEPEVYHAEFKAVDPEEEEMRAKVERLKEHFGK